MGCCAVSSCCFSSAAPEMPEPSIKKMGPTFTNESGYRIISRVEKGNVDKPQFLWVYIPGTGSHSWADHAIGNTIEFVNQNDGWWFSIDKQGNGYSEGYRNYVTSFDSIIDDVATLIKKIYEYPEVDSNTPLFVVGQSLGGLLATMFALKWQEDHSIIPGNFKGLILFAPNLGTASVGPGACVKCCLKNIVLPICPHYRLSPDMLPIEKSVKDPEICKLMDADMLQERAIPLATGSCFLKAWDEIPPRLNEIRVPFFVAHGETDQVCPVSETDNFWEINSTPEHLRSYWKSEDYFHVVTAEPTFLEECAPKIAAWIKSVPDNWETATSTPNQV